MPTEVKSDVLVIGGGIAALSAALEAAKQKVKVALVDKGRPGLSGSTPTSGGVPVFYVPPELGGDPRDSEEIYFNDIVKGGDYLSVQPLAEIMAKEGKERLLELNDLGAPFLRGADGKFVGRVTLGLSYLKVAAIQPPSRMPGWGTGYQLTLPLIKEILYRGASIFENIMVTKLLTGDGRAVGALGFHIKTGEVYLFKAKAVVLAAGSATGLYQNHSASYLTTGDAYAMAYDAGCELMNMEFQEFTVGPAPKGRVVATGGIKPTIAAGALFYDGQGERFMKRYNPEKMEQSRRATLTQAVASEIAAGRGAFLDCTMLKHGTMLTRKLERIPGFDWRVQRIPFVPMIHGFLGGCRVNEWSETNIQGLYAAGESAGFGGLFGADRVGGAIGASIIFGHRAGKAAASLAQKVKVPLPERAQAEEEIRRLRRLSSSRKKEGSRPEKVERSLRALAEKALGVVRSEREMAEAAKEFRRMREELSRLEIKGPGDLKKALEVSNLALAGELVATASLLRKESRGEFLRKDFPARNDKEWLKWIYLRKKKEEISARVVPIPFARYRLRPAI